MRRLFTSRVPNSVRFGEGFVEVERLRVHGHDGEQRVVGFGDGARDGMVDDKADGQILEPPAQVGSAVHRRFVR